MRAALYERFRGPITVAEVPEPEPAEDGVVIRVEATGLCRSDWRGWMGSDPDITLPHVPGHELAGVVEATGRAVTRFRTGDRVTLPFVCGCGSCAQCLSGNHQVCDRQFQPGFTHWGSFAERLAVRYADVNLVRLPDGMSFAAAASLGCRFATAFRGLVDLARVQPGEWVSVHGCGGVGLSAIMIAGALGAHTIAVDIAEDKLTAARDAGAKATVDAASCADVAAAVHALSKGGAHVSVDALGSADTCFDAMSGLRKRGRHVQIGLMSGAARHAGVPMERIVAAELVILGSHGMQAHRYPAMLALIRESGLQPERLIGRTLPLAALAQALPAMATFAGTGVTLIDVRR